MERKRIDASVLRSVGYDPATCALEVELTAGGIVRYAGVSAELHRRLVSAASPGSFFRDHVEEDYPATRVR